jgi:FKBP-type peptidyl-prolyl cis-trans isomerase
MKRPKINIDKEKAKERTQRFIWGFMALLFVITGLGVGLLAFWQSTHPAKPAKPDTSQTDSSTAKLKGTMLTNFTPVSSVSKLEKIDMTVGSGKTVKPGDTVTVQYTGALASTGKIFESSIDTGQPATFPLSQVIKGWTDGLPGMKVNGQRRLLIPAAQAYGERSPSPDIPANSDLVFDIILLEIK